jgi:23S rRNA pseudouridine1911/1915/1917 synthase
MDRVAVAIDRGDVGVRIDRVLLRHLSNIPGVTRNRLQRLIDAGCVTVNGIAVDRASARVRPDDVIAVSLPARAPRLAAKAENLPVDVRYEDDDLLVVNKPPGQVSHPAIGNRSRTLLNALLGYARDRWTPALVSRLDKGTSGVVLVAKSKPMHTALQRLAHGNSITKEYLAIVAGKPPARGTIDLALDHDPWDARRVTVRDRGGVPSVTRFRRIRSIDVSPDGFLSLVACQLVTGRMHQIRVHLAAKGWPIIGDATYGVRFAGLDRQALHASRLAFSHPRTATQVDVTAPPPDDMASVLRLFDVREPGEHRAER